MRELKTWAAAAILLCLFAGARPALAAALEAIDAGSGDGAEEAWDGGAALEAVVNGGHAQAAQAIAPVKYVQTEHAQEESADLGDLLARTEGVSVQRAGGLGSTVRIGLAGLNGNAVKVLVDGIPLELGGFGVGLASIPVDFVERVEIFSGVVPIRMGVDALGGVINVVSEAGVTGFGATASEELGDYLTNRATLSAHWGSRATGLYGRIWGFADYTRNDYPVDETVPNSKGKEMAVVTDLFHNRYRAQEAGLELGAIDRAYADRVYLRVFGSYDDQQLQSNLGQSVPFGEPLYDQNNVGVLVHYEKAGFHGRLKTDVTAGYGHQNNDFLDVGLWVYNWLGQQVTMRQGPGETDSVPHDRHEWQNALYARANASYQVTPDDQFLISFAPTGWNRTGEDRLTPAHQFDALQGRHRLYEQISAAAYQREFVNHRLENQVFIKNYQYAVSAPTASGTLISLTRTNENDWGAGDMLRFNPLDGLTFKASYEDALQLPTVYELFGDSQSIEPNPTLLPERSQNINLGGELRLTTRNAGVFRCGLEGFGRFEQNLILLAGTTITTGTGSTSKFSNVYGARSAGGDASAGWDAPHRWLELNLNGTWEDVRNTSSGGLFGDFVGQPIPNQPGKFVNASGRFNYRHLFTETGTLSIAWYGHYVQSFNTGWANVGMLAAIQSVPTQLSQTLVLSWTALAAELRYSASVELDNLANEKLYDFYGAQRPGRSLYAKLTIQYGTSARLEP